MNKNILLLAIGGIGAYLLLSRKKASATNVEPTKISDGTPKEPSSQADCGEGMRFIPSQKAEGITLTKKDGTTEVVMKEAKPAMCVRIRQGRGFSLGENENKGRGLPLGENENNRYENMQIGMSKELMDAILDLGKISDSSLQIQYDNLKCNPIRKAILTSEQVRKNELKKRALIYVADKRGITLNCKKLFSLPKPLPKERGDNIPYGAPPIENIKRLATGIN